MSIKNKDDIPAIPDIELRKIARAGNIGKDDEVRKLAAFLKSRMRHHCALSEAKKDSRTPKQQLAMMQKYEKQLKSLLDLHDNDRVLDSLLIVAEQNESPKV